MNATRINVLFALLGTTVLILAALVYILLGDQNQDVRTGRDARTESNRLPVHK